MPSQFDEPWGRVELLTSFAFGVLSGLIRLDIFEQAPKMGMQRQDEQSLFPTEAWAINEDHMADKGRHMSALSLKEPLVEGLSYTRYCPKVLQ